MLATVPALAFRTPSLAAPPAGRARRIGVLRSAAAPDALFADPFVKRLRALGYESGRNLFVDWRFANGSYDEALRLAEELVAVRVDLIVAGTTFAAVAVKATTRTIPLVIQSGDAVGAGLVDSLARPGGNVTGVSTQAAETALKGLERLHEIEPRLARAAALVFPPDPFPRLLAEGEAMSKRLGIEFGSVETFGDDLEAAFDALARERWQAVLVSTNLRDHDAEIARLALERNIAVLGVNASIVAKGGLLSVAYDVVELTSRLADFVDKVLNGAAPANLPVEQPTRLIFSLNLRTARALGFTITPSVLARADEVFE